MRSLPFFLGLVIVVGGFTYFSNESAQLFPEPGRHDRYFPTPQAAVMMTTRLVQAGDWQTLASYYESVRDSETAASETAALPVSTLPFPPRAQYLSSRPLDDDEVEVTVRETEETETGIIQKTSKFRLRAHPEGYKLLAQE